MFPVGKNEGISYSCHSHVELLPNTRRSGKKLRYVYGVSHMKNNLILYIHIYICLYVTIYIGLNLEAQAMFKGHCFQHIASDDVVCIYPRMLSKYMFYICA